QGSQRLPFKAIERVARRMALRHDNAGELLARVGVVAVRAGEIELALAPLENGAARANEWLEPGIVAFDREPARLARDGRGEGEEVLALVSQRWCLLLLSPADIDAGLQVNRRGPLGIVGWIARGHTLHGFRRFTVAIGAGAPFRTGLGAPQRLAVEHPQHARIGRVVVLHRPGLSTHLLVGGDALGNWHVGNEDRRPPEQDDGYGPGKCDGETPPRSRP